MKKIYTLAAMLMLASAAFAQETTDTIKVMFDFNLNPWNYPVSTTIKGWNPDYDDEKGAIFKDTDFPWPIAKGSDKNIVVTVYAVDLDEYNRPAVLARFENYDVKTADEQNDSVMTMLFTNPGTSMRFKAPAGYKFAKMMFYDYRQSYYTLETEEVVKAYRFGSWHDDTHKIWIPTTPRKNQYGDNCWEGDETNILFNNIANFKGNFMKIDMRLVPDGSTGISNAKTVQQKLSTVTTLDGRAIGCKDLRKGIYIQNGKKIVVK